MSRKNNEQNFYRLCPNHNGLNENCILLLGYGLEKSMWNAEEREILCTSCAQRMKNAEKDPHYWRIDKLKQYFRDCPNPDGNPK